MVEEVNMKNKIITLALSIAVATSAAVLIITQPKETEAKPNKTVTTQATNDIVEEDSTTANDDTIIVSDTKVNKKAEKAAKKTEEKAKKKNAKTEKSEEPKPTSEDVLATKEEPIPTPRLGYTVRYIDTNGNDIADIKLVTDFENGAFVKEVAPTIEGYEFDSYQITGHSEYLPGYTINNLGEKESVFRVYDGDVVYIMYRKIEKPSYTVKYIDMDTHKEIADNRVVTDFAEGEMVTEHIPTIDGYKFYDVVGDTTEFIVEAHDGDVVYVRYYKDEIISYTVKYVDANGNEIAPSKSVNYIGAATRVIERPIDIDGYKPNRYNVSHNVIENRTITFTYSEIEKASYTVKYIDVKTNDEIASSRVVTDFVEGEMVTEYIPTIEGYEFHSVEAAWAGDATEFIFEAYDDDVVYVRYRKVERISYTVKYIDKTTGNEIAKSEVGSWIKGDVFTRYFNRTIDGYNYDGVRYNGQTYTTKYIMVDNLNDGDVIEFLLTPIE